MAKEKVALEVPSSQVNPQVSIVYSPEKALVILGHDAQDALDKLTVAEVKDVKSLERAATLIHDGETALERIASCRDAFAERVKEAFEPFRKLDLFAEASINITLTIPLRQRIETAVKGLKSSRARYLDEERRKQEREQLARDAEQRRINEEAAKKAAAEAKRAGADKETVAQIKSDVMAIPAPTVVSRAAETAKNTGATLRYKYTAEITSLREFLGSALSNQVLFNTLAAAVPEIEHVFDKMAAAQKELFSYPGITYRKTPIDVDRGK